MKRINATLFLLALLFLNTMYKRKNREVDTKHEGVIFVSSAFCFVVSVTFCLLFFFSYLVFACGALFVECLQILSVRRGAKKINKR